MDHAHFLFGEAFFQKCRRKQGEIAITMQGTARARTLEYNRRYCFGDGKRY